jgi:hypothetical protein
MSTVLRLIVLALVLGGAMLTVAGLQRRIPRTKVGLGPGITLVTGPGCTLCGAARNALSSAGGSIAEVDVNDLVVAPLRIRSLPTVYVVANDGRVLARRSGRAAITDAHRLVASLAAVE